MQEGEQVGQPKVCLKLRNLRLILRMCMPNPPPLPLVSSVTLSDPEIEAQIGARHPIGRMGTAEECAAVIHWLCFDAASFVTGRALVVDGGYVAQ